MIRQRTPLDSYDEIPADLRNYLANYGKHFNEKLCTFAVKQMRDKEGKRVGIIKKDVLSAKLKENSITIENDVMHDSVFVYCMALSDFYGSSIADEKHLLMYVKDLIDDPDQADGFIFGRFMSDCIGKGLPIDWSEMI